MKLSSGRLRKCHGALRFGEKVRAAYGFVSSSSRRWIVRSYSLYAAAEQRNLSLRSESKYRAHLARLYENG